jgi:hypothetical protein
VVGSLSCDETLHSDCVTAWQDPYVLRNRTKEEVGLVELKNRWEDEPQLKAPRKLTTHKSTLVENQP